MYRLSDRDTMDRSQKSEEKDQYHLISLFLPTPVPNFTCKHFRNMCNCSQCIQQREC